MKRSRSRQRSQSPLRIRSNGLVQLEALGKDVVGAGGGGGTTWRRLAWDLCNLNFMLGYIFIAHEPKEEKTVGKQVEFDVLSCSLRKVLGIATPFV